MKTPYIPKKKLRSLLEKIEGRNLKSRTRKALIVTLLNSPECYTHEDIAESLGVDRTYITQISCEYSSLTKIDKDYERLKDLKELNRQIASAQKELKALENDPLLWGKEKRETRKQIAELIEKKHNLLGVATPAVVVQNTNVNTTAVQTNGNAGGLTGEDREFQERMLETLQRRFSTK